MHFHRVACYRSGLEGALARQLKSAGVSFTYEVLKIPYTIPASPHTYTPDFVLKENGIIIESKGLFSVEDRKKHLLVKAQHPEYDIRFVFQNPNARLYKGSPTTYAMWAEKNGFKWAGKQIPEEWLSEQSKPWEREIKGSQYPAQKELNVVK